MNKTNIFSTIGLLGLISTIALLSPGNCLALPNSAVAVQSENITTQSTDLYTISVEEIYGNLNHPWGMAWYKSSVQSAQKTQDYPMLLTERNGAVWIVVEGNFKQISNLPADVYQQGQGGWFDIAQGAKGEIYLSYAKGTGTDNATALLVFDLDDADVFGNASTVQAKNVQQVFVMNKSEASRLHFGGMMSLAVIDGIQHIYLGLGERGQRYLSQDKNLHHGATMQIIETAHREYTNQILSYGHRNTQGIFYDAKRAILYQHEHGPKGGDEVNIILEGRNYGWPTVSYGKEYGSGKQVGEGTVKPGMEDPLYYWPVSPAISGMLVYYGEVFSAWNGDIIIGALKLNQLYRLQLNDAGSVVEKEELLFSKKFGRIRAIEQGPDGYIYFITDQNKGKLYRLGLE